MSVINLINNSNLSGKQLRYNNDSTSVNIQKSDILK